MNLHDVHTLLEFYQKGEIWALILNQEEIEGMKDLFWRLLTYQDLEGSLWTDIGEFWNLDLDMTP